MGNDYIGDGYVAIDFKSPNRNSFTVKSFRELLEEFNTSPLHIESGLSRDKRKRYIDKISKELNIKTAD